MSTRYDRGMSEPEDGSSPLAEALARVGDRWTLLVVEALLPGPRRFSELLDQIPGIAANILSERLKRLEREALLVARPYSERPPRAAYQLTAEGQELAGAVRLLAYWGARRAARLASPVARASRACPARLRAVHGVLRAARLRFSASASTGRASSDLPCRTFRMPCCTRVPATSHLIPDSSARARDPLRWRRAWS